MNEVSRSQYGDDFFFRKKYKKTAKIFKKTKKLYKKQFTKVRNINII